MKVKKIRVGRILGDIFIPEKSKNLIIYCKGIPGRYSYGDFLSKLAEETQSVVLYPRYLGSWDSYGVFSVENSFKTIEMVINKIKRVKDIFGNPIKLDFDDLTLLGHSFGGSVALIVGAKRKEVDRIIALAPIIDYRSHNSEGNEEDLDELYKFIKLGFENIYRDLNYKDWRKLYKINVLNYMGGLREKRVLLMHGKKDMSVDYRKTKSFYNLLKNTGVNVTLKLLNSDHGGIRERSIKFVRSWL